MQYTSVKGVAWTVGFCISFNLNNYKALGVINKSFNFDDKYHFILFWYLSTHEKSSIDMLTKIANAQCYCTDLKYPGSHLW